MILFLTDESVDYGPDYLFDGFATLFGIEQVVDHPAKPSLHGSMTGFDCDLRWPRLSDFDRVDYIFDREFDLLVVPTLRGDVIGRLHAWRNGGFLDRFRDCTVCYDAEDHTLNTKQHFVDALGYEPVAYFKRELPIGETWATPLPFGYPEERIVAPTSTSRIAAAAYSAFIWNWSHGGMREQLCDALNRWVYTLPEEQRIAAALKITATQDAGERLSVAADHAMHQRCLVAVSPAGQGSTTNRHLQCISDGCAPIWERLTVEYPNAPHAGTEALYFDTADEAVTHVRTLLGDPAYAISMAQAAQAKLRQHHTTAVRARTVWGAVHGSL